MLGFDDHYRAKAGDVIEKVLGPNESCKNSVDLGT